MVKTNKNWMIIINGNGKQYQNKPMRLSYLKLQILKPKNKTILKYIIHIITVIIHNNVTINGKESMDKHVIIIGITIPVTIDNIWYFTQSSKLSLEPLDKILAME